MVISRSFIMQLLSHGMDSTVMAVESLFALQPVCRCFATSGVVCWCGQVAGAAVCAWCVGQQRPVDARHRCAGSRGDWQAAVLQSVATAAQMLVLIISTTKTLFQTV